MIHTRAVGSAVRRADLASLGLGASLTVAMAYAAVAAGPAIALGPIVALLAFAALVAVFATAPHVAVAGAIPLFAAIPTLKLFVPAVGPTKDAITVAAVAALLLACARRGGWPADRWVSGAVGLLIGLYVLNLGGGFARESFGVAWLHGVRLVSEPLLLLVVGLGLAHSQRTLRWAVGSLVATATFVALVGLGQQVAGPARLVALGYDYNDHVRTINGHLRSFGTFDEPFAYAAFLLFGLAAVLFGLRRGPLAYATGAVLAAGLATSLARTAAVVSIALLGVWLARHGHIPAAVLLGAAALVASGLLFATAGGTQSQTVVAGSSTYLTINGRTEAWRLALGRPAEWPFGRGVGEVGTAAERARLTVSGSRRRDDEPSGAVDSGYFAAVADVGLVGLAVLAALFARLTALARRAIRHGQQTGWLAAGMLTVLLIDALTRASFTAFPTAYLGLLLTGLALRAAADDEARRA
jgi:putative inorganic carbon (hco3(-)) transporter